VSLGGVVGSTALLMSPAGAITGQSLRVDGGAGINTVALPLDQYCRLREATPTLVAEMVVRHGDTNVSELHRPVSAGKPVATDAAMMGV
jgi:hypothetical protein